LGNTLYPKIKQLIQDESVVPKVTGMLVDLECLGIDDIRHMIESADELRSRVAEAMDIIKEQNNNMMEHMEMH